MFFVKYMIFFLNVKLREDLTGEKSISFGHCPNYLYPPPPPPCTRYRTISSIFFCLGSVFFVFAYEVYVYWNAENSFLSSNYHSNNTKRPFKKSIVEKALKVPYSKKSLFEHHIWRLRGLHGSISSENTPIWRKLSEVWFGKWKRGRQGLYWICFIP